MIKLDSILHGDHLYSFIVKIQVRHVVKLDREAHGCHCHSIDELL